MQLLSIFTVDAFSSTAFRGNPAAICLPGTQGLTESRMGEIAAEMNLSETAFVLLLKSTDSYETSKEFSLRWFTPTHEVSLCGHATLASACVLFQCMDNKASRLTFHTLSGRLQASRDPNDVISLDFPLNPPTAVQTPEFQESVNEMAKLVCADKSASVVDTQYSPATKKLLLRLADCPNPKELLEELKPNFAEMLRHDCCKVKGVIVTCRRLQEMEDGVDFYSRYFAPWVGINEDPVTGSAHTVLAPYWSTILGKKTFHAIQCSKRSGELMVECVDGNRCVLKGNAVVILQGSICNPS